MPSARVATTAIFFVTGSSAAAWSTRIPAVQGRLDLSAGELAIAVLGIEGGAILGLTAGGILTARGGSRRALAIGFAVFPAALLAIALAPGLATLTLVVLVWAAANSVIDVAMNAQAIELERRHRRPLLAGMHAGHSLGLVAGGVAGVAAAATGLSLVAHYAIASGIVLATGLAATRRLVPEAAVEARPAVAGARGPLLLLGLVAFCAFLLDGSALHWSAVHLRSELGAAPALAAAAPTLFALTVAAGRLAGDRLVARAGRLRVVQGCGALAAAGAAAAVTAPTGATGLAGWALLGLGVSAIAPVVLGAAPSASAARAPVAIAAVTTVGYLGSFTGPPAIGALAGLASLRFALGLLVVVGLAVALLARPALRNRARTAA
jgi:MFS family permease